MTINRPLVFGLLCGRRLSASALCGGADKPNDELTEMIVESAAPTTTSDMCAVGLQQVREEAKGPAATKRFADAAARDSPPDGQVGLLDALADRGDNTAKAGRPRDAQEPGRAGARGGHPALGSLGEAADVPLLVQSLAAAPKAGTKGGRQISLTAVARAKRQCGPCRRNEAGQPDLRRQLLGLLVARRAVDTIPAILEAAADADASGGARRPWPDSGSWPVRNTWPAWSQALLKMPRRTTAGSGREGHHVRLQPDRRSDKRADPAVGRLGQRRRREDGALAHWSGVLGGPAALKLVDAAMADAASAAPRGGFRALCNWPDASVAARLIGVDASRPATRTTGLRPCGR